MPVIEVSDIVRASLEDTYVHICNPEEYPLLFPEVCRVLVVERLPQGARTLWEIDVDGLKFKWEQQEQYFPEEWAVRFQQVKGDMLRFAGIWNFSQTDEGTQVRLYLDFDPGIPMLTGLFHYILVSKVREILQEMINGFKRVVEVSREASTAP